MLRGNDKLIIFVLLKRMQGEIDEIKFFDLLFRSVLSVLSREPTSHEIRKNMQLNCQAKLRFKNRFAINQTKNERIKILIKNEVMKGKKTFDSSECVLNVNRIRI